AETGASAENPLARPCGADSAAVAFALGFGRDNCLPRLNSSHAFRGQDCPRHTLRLPLSVRHRHATLNLRDTEVPAKTEEIDWTDGPGNHDKVDLIRFLQENRDIADRIVLQAHPEIRHPWASVLLVVVHHLLPAGRAVLVFHGVHRLRIIRPSSRKMVAVYRDPTHACDYAAQV